MVDRADRRDAIWEQRNPLEHLVQRIPGFRGYFGRENRREADRLLREFGVDHLDRVISELQRAARGAGLADLGTYGELIDQVEKDSLFDMIFVPDDPRRPANVAVFLCRFVGGELRPGSDAAEAAWFDLDALPEDLAFRNAELILDRLPRG